MLCEMKHDCYDYIFKINWILELTQLSYINTESVDEI